MLIPQALVMVVGLQVAPVVEAVEARVGIAVGLLICGAGFVSSAGAVDGGVVGPVVLGVCVAAVGVSLPMALLTGLLLTAAPPEQAGAVSAVRRPAPSSGIALGVAVVGTLANVSTGVRQRQRADGLSPSQLATAAREINGHSTWRGRCRRRSGPG